MLPLTRSARALLALFVVVGSQSIGAQTAVLNPAVNVVQLGSSTVGLNNSIALVDGPGPVTVAASGAATFGSNPGEIYHSTIVNFRDQNDASSFEIVPLGQSRTITGNHYDRAFITDQIGTIPGNTGSINVDEFNASNNLIGGGTIFAGSTTPAQTGPAEVGPANTAYFDTPPIPQLYTVTASGSAFYAPGKPFADMVVQYRDASNGIEYAVLPIGSSHAYIGYRFRIFIVDSAGQTADNTGSITVTLSPAPEPGTMTMLGVGIAAGLKRWRARQRH